MNLDQLTPLDPSAKGARVQQPLGELAVLGCTWPHTPREFNWLLGQPAVTQAPPGSAGRFSVVFSPHFYCHQQGIILIFACLFTSGDSKHLSIEMAPLGSALLTSGHHLPHPGRPAVPALWTYAGLGTVARALHTSFHSPRHHPHPPTSHFGDRKVESGRFHGMPMV